MSNQSDEFIIALQDMMQLITSDYKGMIIGGIAIIALGYPRETTDNYFVLFFLTRYPHLDNINSS